MGKETRSGFVLEKKKDVEGMVHILVGVIDDDNSDMR